MKLFAINIICAFLHVSCQNPTDHWTLVPNTLVLEVDGGLGQYPLSCLDSAEEVMSRDDQGRDIIWKKNGEELPQKGNVYSVQLEESLGGGNYTCHSKNGSLLNHTVVLIKEEESKRKRILIKTDQDYLKCSAQNYNGDFHCSWTWHRSRVGEVAFIRVQRVSDSNDTHCTVDVSGQLWTCSTGQRKFRCSVDDSGQSISCLDEQHCPYAEEIHLIYISVYVKTEHFLVENYSKYFYLSEIVKPDKVRISEVNKSLIEWTYPSSWASPYSYFPLTFQIAQFRKECRNCANPCTELKPTKMLTVHSSDRCSSKVKHKTKTVCVRAKDAFSNSEWGEWSHIR
uniref:Interleukin-12 subunit beta n=2 Tax=Sphaeramia orbicularis TaxID=375764 RepID=A0A673BS79_9TELE